MKRTNVYTSPLTDITAVAACNEILQASHGFPQVSTDDNTITYEQTTDDSFGSDESVAARPAESWNDDWEEWED